MTYSTGCLPSPYDYRDFPVASYINVSESGELPKSFQYQPLEILDQNGTGSCVGHGMATIKQKQEHNERNKIQSFSVQMIYWNRDEDMYHGEGMYPRDALKKLQKDGVCEKHLMPGNLPYSKKDESKFTPEVFENAKYQKIKSYARIYNIHEFKSSLLVNGVCGLSIPVYDGFNKPLPNGYVPYIKNSDINGYHWIVGLGWNELGLIIQNSWSDRWGNKGIGILPYDYPIDEMWTILDDLLPPPASEYDIIFKVGEKSYTVNNQVFTMDTEPKIKDNRTFVPLRFLGAAMGYGVEYYVQNNKEYVSLTNKDKKVVFTIGDRFYYVNDEFKYMDTTPYIDENWRSMIPVRFAVEALGGKVDFKDYTIYINKK